MWPISFLRSLKSDSPCTLRQRGRRQGRQQRLPFVPRVDVLEDRTLLSYTFTPIADTAGSYSSLSHFNPTMNQAGTVAFGAELRSGGEAILTSDGGSPAIVAITSDLVSAFSLGPLINSA